MFKILVKTLTSNGFEHYEISNFAKKGYRSIHNSNYWNNTHYLGIGPASHSFNGNSRQWNFSNVKKYIQLVNEHKTHYEIEDLTTDEKYNDLIITRLRTKEGINLTELKNTFGEKKYNYCINNARHWIDNNQMILNNDTLSLTNDGIFISDSIFADLIIAE